MNFRYPRTKKLNNLTYDNIVIKIQKQHKIFGKSLKWMKDRCISVTEGRTVYRLESNEVYVEHLISDESGRFVRGTWKQKDFGFRTSNILLGTITTDFTDDYVSVLVELLRGSVQPASAGYDLCFYPIKFKINDFYFIVGYISLFQEGSNAVLKNSIDNFYVTRFWANPEKYKPGVLYKIKE